MKKKILLTGIKPTGTPHLGNYIGAIRPAFNSILKEQDAESYYFIADYHALTTTPDKKSYRQNILEVAAAWMAFGPNTDNIFFYKQSDVPEVCELYWILSCFTPKGAMNRAHTYKSLTHDNEVEKRDRDHGINMGIFSYPILMAADILIVDADVVPVGPDQCQHLEITGEIARAFNHRYGQVLKTPKALINTPNPIAGLDGRKMSKSYGNHIPLFLAEKKLKKYIGRIVTDSTPVDDPKDPENSIIFDLFAALAPSSDAVASFKADYEKGISWGRAKEQLFEMMVEHFRPYKKIFDELLSDSSQVDQRLKQGAEKARERAGHLLKKIKKALGVLP